MFTVYAMTVLLLYFRRIFCIHTKDLLTTTYFFTLFDKIRLISFMSPFAAATHYLDSSLYLNLFWIER